MSRGWFVRNSDAGECWRCLELKPRLHPTDGLCDDCFEQYAAEQNDQEVV